MLGGLICATHICDLKSSNVFQEHPWFRGIQWDKLYEMEAAYKPTVNGELDTQNFEKFPEVSRLELLGLIVQSNKRMTYLQF